jgi:uncharacterized protein with PhoU and TrkA domain
MAIKVKDDWIFNPRKDYILKPQSTLIVMTTPDENSKLQSAFGLK